MDSLGKLEFVVFVIEGIAERLGITGQQAYRKLTDGWDTLHRYVIPSYDVLHTQGKAYVVDDVLRVLEELGT